MVETPTPLAYSSARRSACSPQDPERDHAGRRVPLGREEAHRHCGGNQDYAEDGPGAIKTESTLVIAWIASALHSAPMALARSGQGPALPQLRHRDVSVLGLGPGVRGRDGQPGERPVGDLQVFSLGVQLPAADIDHPVCRPHASRLFSGQCARGFKRGQAGDREANYRQPDSAVTTHLLPRMLKGSNCVRPPSRIAASLDTPLTRAYVGVRRVRDLAVRRRGRIAMSGRPVVLPADDHARSPAWPDGPSTACLCPALMRGWTTRVP
jgi:hypothetical protein